MQRAPTAAKSFVRGKSGQMPFWPGGLDEVLGDLDAIGSGESTKGLKTIPPGFSRGLRLPGDDPDVDDLDALRDDCEADEEVPLVCKQSAGGPFSRISQSSTGVHPTAPGPSTALSEIDDLLPANVRISSALLPHI